VTALTELVMNVSWLSGVGMESREVTRTSVRVRTAMAVQYGGHAFGPGADHWGGT
jgi:hypothetical protein